MDDKRTEQLNVRLSPIEVKVLRAAAEERGLTASTYMRLLMRERLMGAFRAAREPDAAE